LSRPEVREFTWNVIQNTLKPNPDISYVKWDCNCYITQPGSTWLGQAQQSHLLLDYQRSLYDIIGPMETNFPNVMVMLCSGGAGRCDFGALRFFHSFWPSDNTDPARRILIQWGFSHFFPAGAIAAHVTKMGHRPLKIALDVAMSGALGLDLDVGKLSSEERRSIAAAVALYKEELRDVVLLGDLYRLESPYAGPRAALDFVSEDRARAVLFVYQLKANKGGPVRVAGLDPEKSYRIREVNLPEGASSSLASNEQTIQGSVLLHDGILPSTEFEWTSSVIELTSDRVK
jgi:alpha-galactosidase